MNLNHIKLSHILTSICFIFGLFCSSEIMALGADDKKNAEKLFSEIKPIGDSVKDKFMKKVFMTHYENHINRGSKPVNLNVNLVSVGKVKFIPDAAKAINQLLSKANSDLSRDKSNGNECASVTNSIGLLSGFRSIDQEKKLWRRVYLKYFNASKNKRSKAKGGEYSDDAVKILLFKAKNGKGLVHAKAVPGFSRHSKGIAADFETYINYPSKNNFKLHAVMEQNKAWRTNSWFYQWLKNKCGYIWLCTLFQRSLALGL